MVSLHLVSIIEQLELILGSTSGLYPEEAIWTDASRDDDIEHDARLKRLAAHHRHHRRSVVIGLGVLVNWRHEHHGPVGHCAAEEAHREVVDCAVDLVNIHVVVDVRVQVVVVE